LFSIGFYISSLTFTLIGLYGIKTFFLGKCAAVAHLREKKSVYFKLIRLPKIVADAAPII